MTYAEVAVDAPAGHDRTFSYSVPPTMTIALGQAVWVPFGPRVLAGIVFELPRAPQVERTRDILRPLDPRPVLTPPQLALARWLSRTYLAPLFDAASLMLPPGFLGRASTVVALAPHALEEQERVSRTHRRILSYLEGRGWVEQTTLTRALGRAAEAALPNLIRRRLVLRDWRWRPSHTTAKLISYLRPAVPLSLEVVEELKRARASRQAELLEYLLAASEPLPAAWARKRFGPSSVGGLLQKGYAVEERVRQVRDPLAGQVFPQDSPLHLTPAQVGALSQITAALDDPAQQPRSFLLYGVTGSGKTEVYLRALEHAVARGKKGIVLVPEIALTPQTIRRFAARFPGRVAVLHSRLTPGQRYDQWWRIREGGCDVVVGPRSALFAPQPELGLVVIDEEHEWTYKQEDQSPRYHAGEASLELAKLTGAVVVLGSATPDVVTYYRSTSGGYHRLLELPQRVARDGRSSSPGALPAVELVDMRRELREGNRSIFSRSLREGMLRALEAGEQIILFLNRRGSATHVQCRDCGYTLRCRRCDTTLTHHSARERLLCHQCGYTAPVPLQCPACHSLRIRFLGLGTQRAVQEVQAAFPETQVLRWDRDAAALPGAHDRILQRFLEGQAQVLVGTQMVAKGLHLPGVTLAGVLLADMGLGIPDFRASERIFQLLCQVAGRAGRGSAPGRAIIQTYSPESYPILAAARQDYEAFYRQELQYRKEHHNPPFSRLARLLYLHTNEAMCQREAQRLARVLRRRLDALGDPQTQIVGPAPAFPHRRRGRYRWHLLVRSPDPAQLLRPVPLPQGWIVDIDPVTVA